jgi:hypothetical protein
MSPGRQVGIRFAALVYEQPSWANRSKKADRNNILLGLSAFSARVTGQNPTNGEIQSPSSDSSGIWLRTTAAWQAAASFFGRWSPSPISRKVGCFFEAVGAKGRQHNLGGTAPDPISG